MKSGSSSTCSFLRSIKQLQNQTEIVTWVPGASIQYQQELLKRHCMFPGILCMCCLFKYEKTKCHCESAAGGLPAWESYPQDFLPLVSASSSVHNIGEQKPWRTVLMCAWSIRTSILQELPVVGNTICRCDISVVWLWLRFGTDLVSGRVFTGDSRSSTELGEYQFDFGGIFCILWN